MYGATPVCPRCSKLVYQAEQTMGPGRKLYHKPCLACMSCSKRLDSFTLLEHDEQPYCKSCHLKLFGTRDLRHANLPQASPPASPTYSQGQRSPLRHTPTGSGNFTGSFTNAAGSTADKPVTPPRTAPQPSFWATRGVPAAAAGPSRATASGPILPPRTIEQERGIVHAPAWDDEDYSSGAANATHRNTNADEMDNVRAEKEYESMPMDADGDADGQDGADEREVHDALTDHEVPSTPFRAQPLQRESEHEQDQHRSSPVRTIPLSLSAARGISYNHASPHPRAESPTPSNAGGAPRESSPVRTSFTGTRYGAALSPARTGAGGAYASGGGGKSSGRPGGAFGLGGTNADTNMSTTTVSPIRPQGTGAPRWGGGGETPLCARCGGRVYFAEQVKAVNKTFHKACLRCTECGTSLDSRSLRDHEGTVFCARCYNKNYGPQGGGYALLGKAGG